LQDTSGSICIVVNNEIAIAGDTLFGIFKNSAFPPFAYNTEKLIQSWEELLETGCNTFLPSHGHEKSREQLQSEFMKKKSQLTE